MKRLISDGVKVQTCVTSPPYWGLRDYGHDDQLGLEKTPEEYVANMVDVFRMVKELLHDDGTLWLNLGDSYYNYRPGKGQSLVKQTVSNTNQDLPQDCDRRGLKQKGLKEKDLVGIPWRVAFALQADGWYLRQDIIWHKPNPMPESVTDRCTKSHEYIFLLSKNAKYYYDNEAILTPYTEPMNRWGGQKLVAKGQSTWDEGVGQETYRDRDMRPNENGSNKKSVWTVATKPYADAHFAVFPTELIEPCILAGSRKGDTVLDPFFGSGTTGEVSENLGRKWIGIELNPEYEELQKRRTAQIGLGL
tara:strand:- start:511 stop:1422 length:912 start_codon:yes stop_codon:yes gene_type:complete